jgi:chromosome segregation ATPase
MLQRQVSALTQERDTLASQLAHEHEEHEAAVRRLSTAFSERVAERAKLSTERCTLESLLETEQERVVNSLSMQIEVLVADRVVLRRENERLKAHLRSLGVSRSVSPALSRGTPDSGRFSSPRD